MPDFLWVYSGAMRFWFARNSDVPIREQLVTQVVLGILSDDLHPGERLPSTGNWRGDSKFIPTPSARLTGSCNAIAGLNCAMAAGFTCG